MINNDRLLNFIKDGESQTVEFKTSFQKEVIALMFKECGLIEKYGSGIGRIKKFCKAHNIIEPKFEEIQKGFQVTLYKKVLAQKLDGGINGGINLLLAFISENQNLSAKTISEHMNEPLRTIQRWIKQLKDEDKIEYRGSKKNGGYYVK